MKKKYGLLFLLCLLMFFCINIDGVEAKVASKTCIYKGKILVQTSTGGTQYKENKADAGIGITYTCTTGSECEYSYYAARATSPSGNSEEFKITGSDVIIENTDYFYDKSKEELKCADNVYILREGTSTNPLYRFSYKKKDGYQKFTKHKEEGNIRTEVINIAKSGKSEDTSSTSSSGDTTNQDMIDEIKDRANKQKKDQENGNIGIDEESTPSCSDVLGDKFSKFLKSIFVFISVGGIILLIILMSFDFIKVITSSEDNAMSEAFKRVRNRVLAVILLLLLPVLVNFLIGIINNNLHMEDGKITVGDVSDCNIK